MNVERISIAHLPSATIDCVCNYIAQFTVGLTRVFRERSREDLQLIGTGTLVEVEGVYCILTAEHVLAKIRERDQLSLLSSFSGGLGRYPYDPSHIDIHRIAEGADDSKGPDIGLIVLPQTNVGFLRAEKAFFNIDTRRQRFSECFLQRDRGFWFTCGIIGESEIDLDPRPGFSGAKGYQALCGASGITMEYEDSGFDYLEVTVDNSASNPELPRSFGGFSGGGVWQVPLEKNERGEITAQEYVLSGVVFYQTADEKGFRRLRCHGRKTVYEKVPEFIKLTKGS